MILTKMKKIVLILSLCFLTQCYTEPFFELTVKVVDQETNGVSDVKIKVLVQDIENGEPVEGSTILMESTTNDSGQSSFSFDNKAFVTVQCCYEASIMMCKDGAVYLEENVNKDFTLMLEEMNNSDDGENCSYCFED